MRQQEVSASVEATGSWAEDRLLQNTLAPACIDYSPPRYLIKVQMWRLCDANFISLACLNNVKGQIYTIPTQPNDFKAVLKKGKEAQTIIYFV